MSITNQQLCSTSLMTSEINNDLIGSGNSQYKSNNLDRSTTNNGSSTTKEPLICGGSSLYTTYNKVIYINGKRFYPYLIPHPKHLNLLQSKDYHSGDFIIAKDHIYRKGSESRKCPIFTAFRTYIDAFHWIRSLHIEERCCYEIIPSEFADEIKYEDLTNKDNFKNHPTVQKPHFDIDIESKDHDIILLGEEVKNAVTSSINIVMKSYNVQYNKTNHLLIYSSHRIDKRSFHIIINGFYHNSPKEAGAFYQLVINNVPEHLRKYVDHSVYKRYQQFRGLGNHKIGKDNIKTIDPSTEYIPDGYKDIRNIDPITIWNSNDYDDQVSLLRNFEASLITFTSGCIQLPSFIPNNKNGYNIRRGEIIAPRSEITEWIKNNSHKGIDTSSLGIVPETRKVNYYGNNTIYSCYDYYDECVDAFDKSVIHKFFEITGISNDWIILKGDHITDCIIHKRVHENDNAYIFIDYLGVIYVRCRRSERKDPSFPIGNINISKNKTQPVSAENDDIQIDENDDTGDWLGAVNLKTGEIDPNRLNTNNDESRHEITNNNKDVKIVNTNVDNKDIKINILDNDVIINTTQRKLRIATDEDFYNFLTAAGCNDPIKHKIGDHYKHYCEYCRSNTIIPQSIPVDNIIPPSFGDNITVKRPSTLTDINNFLELLRVPDNNSKIKCKDLHPYFDLYCQSNSIINNYKCRSFTENIKKLTNFNLINYRTYQYITGVSLNSGKFTNNDSKCQNVGIVCSSLKLSNKICNSNIDDKNNKCNSFPLLDLMTCNNNNGDNKITDATTIYNKNNNTLITTDNGVNHVCPITNDKLEYLFNNRMLVSLNVPNYNDNIEKLGISNDSNSEIIIRDTTIEDVDVFVNDAIKMDPDSRLPISMVDEAFKIYCDKNGLKQTIKGVKLFNMIADRNIIKITSAENNRYLEGCAFKTSKDPREQDDIKATRGYNRLFNNWTDPYLIGWNNGPHASPIDMQNNEEWNNIDITYTDTLPILAITEMIKYKSIMDDYSDIPQITKETDSVKRIVREFVHDELIDIENDEEMIDSAYKHIINTMNNNILELVEDWKSLSEKYILVIKAACGAGKTQNIKPYLMRLDEISDAIIKIKNEIRNYYRKIGVDKNMIDMTEIYKRPSIIICVNRRTLSNKFYREYRRLGFKICNKGDAISKYDDRIIVCYPSIKKVIGRIFDIAIFDEYCSTIKLHFQVTKEKRRCYNRMRNIMRQTKKVIIADAGLKNRHILDIRRISERPIIVHQNIAKPLEGKILYAVSRKGILTKKIIQTLREGKRAAIPTSSKKYAKLLKQRIEKELPNVKIGIFTADETAEIDDDPICLFHMYDCVIYTGTIQAGNSYTEPIDAVYGYFMTETADYEDIMQMLLRCRNVKDIHVCIDEIGYKKRIIPNDVKANVKSIKEYILDEDVMTRGYLETKEFKLPFNEVDIDDKGEIDPNDAYINLYCGYIKDLVMQQRGTTFLLMLALRDQGIKFGGYSGRKEYDEEAEEIEKDMRKKIKEINDNERDLIIKSRDISDEEAKKMEDKEKTQLEVMQLRKYRIKKEYGVEVTEKLIKKTRGKHLKHNNLVKCAKVSGIGNDGERDQLMRKIGEEIINGKEMPDDVIERMDYIRKVMRVKQCYHALNVLKILNINNFMDYVRSGARSIIMIDNKMKEIAIKYIEQQREEVRHILKLDEDVTFVENNIMNVVDELLCETFGINITRIISKQDNYYIKSMWTTIIGEHGKELIIPMGYE